MATSTPNLNLILPDYSDKADISVLNDNFQKIDEYCANGGVSNEEFQNAVKAANAWANATASAESVSADNEADVKLTEGYDSKNLHFSIPRGQPGVLISETEPTDPNVKVWIKPDGEPNELEQLKSDVSSLKDHNAAVETALNMVSTNLVDTETLVSVITNAAGADTTGVTWDAYEGYIVCSAALQTHGRRLLSGQKIPVKEGETYTLSGYVKWGNTNSDKQVIIGLENQYINAVNVPASEATKWTRVSHTVTVDATTAAYGEARIVFQSENAASMPMYLKDIQLENGSSMTDYVPYGQDKTSQRLNSLEAQLENVNVKAANLLETEKGFFYLANYNTPIVETAENGALLVTLPDSIIYKANHLAADTYTITRDAMINSLGSVAVAHGTYGVQITQRYQTALALNTETMSLEIVDIKNVDYKHMVLLYNGYDNPYGPMMQYNLRTRVKALENRFTGGDYEWESAAKEYAALFNNTDNVESFMFFTDPHLVQGSAWEEAFTEYTAFAGKVFDATPTTFCVSGGDWLVSGDTQDTACYNLGRIDSRMRSVIPEYVPMVGNHDTNYQGKLDDYSETYTGTLTDATIRNLWFRREGAAYYRYKGATSAMYVLDSGTDISAPTMSAYYWEQIDWLAQSLKVETDENVILALHIIYNHSTDAVAALAENAFALAEAYNARTSITLNGVTYDFAGCTGRVRFAISGHMHMDMIGTLHGIPFALTTNMTAESVPTFDLVLADWDTGTAHFVRVGSGESRSITMA